MSSMARPQTVTDDEIMQAARRVIGRRGYTAFTLAEVAEELGVSRTAIILRFKSTRELKVRITTETIASLRREMAELPVVRSGDGLLQLAASIGAHTPSRADVATLMLVSQGNLADPELATLERERGHILRDAISARMPETSLKHDVAVRAFIAHIAGSVSQWRSGTDPSPTKFLVERTEEWLTLAHIPFTRKKPPRKR